MTWISYVAHTRYEGFQNCLIAPFPSWKLGPKVVSQLYLQFLIIGRGGWLWIFRKTTTGHFVFCTKLLWWIWQCGWNDVSWWNTYVFLPGNILGANSLYEAILNQLASSCWWICYSNFCFLQILKPSEKKAKYQYQGLNAARPVTPRGPTGVPGMKRK